MIRSRRIRRIPATCEHGVLMLDGENLDAVNRNILHDAGIEALPEHRPSWHITRQHLSRATGVTWQGCFWIADRPGADTPERDAFLHYLDRTCKFEIRIVEVPLAAGYARTENALDNAIVGEVARILTRPDCPAHIGVASCDGDFLALLETIAASGKHPVLVTFVAQCARRMLETCRARGWTVLDLGADLRSWAGRALEAEIMAAHAAAARAGTSTRAAPIDGPLQRARVRVAERLAAQRAEPRLPLGAKRTLALRRSAEAR